MAEHQHRTSNEPIDRLLDNPFAMTLLSIMGAAGAIVTIAAGYRLVTAFAWAIGG